MGHVMRRGALVAAMITLAAATAPSALAASSSSQIRPRIRNALGLAPLKGNSHFEPSEFGFFTPVTYHGGPTMTGGVTVHTVFWAPAGYHFQGAPPGSRSYIRLIEQYYVDVAAAGTGGAGAPCQPTSCNVFTVEPQYARGTRPGGVISGKNTVHYKLTSDVVMDRDPYHSGCTSPQDARACVTDFQVQLELDRIIQATPGRPRGLHNIWYVFLPPNVDECISPGQCDSNAFGGYHSAFNIGHGLTVYAITGDPIIEFGGSTPGEDPEGNPDAELALDIAAHETNEAMTDPTGTGWFDPNGWEVGDKCEFGDEKGTPLGYASNGSPYNQVINGHEYFIQEMWSNPNRGCVQATTKTANPLPLPQVGLTQFSSRVTGSIERSRRGVHVTVKLIRANAQGRPITVATGHGITGSGGRWVAFLSGGHVVGDDRDQVKVSYSGPGSPSPDVIRTGNGGNPFTESGWTGWTALDEGTALSNHDPFLGGRPSLSLGPCFQTGTLTADGVPATQFCNTSTDVADTPLPGRIPQRRRVTVSSNDNRGFDSIVARLTKEGPSNLVGTLVKLTVPVGEPDSAPNFHGQLPGFLATGFPICTADLGAQRISCSGLVPGRTYSVENHGQSIQGKADSRGRLSKPMRLRGGTVVRLRNSARTLTALHMANLVVHLSGNSPEVSGGTCTPGEYWGGPLRAAPRNPFAGAPSDLFGGAALTGEICPTSGHAAGLPTDDIAQTDEHSGGQTVTEVAKIANTSPVEGETMYGSFRAVARASGRPRISLKITHAGGKELFRAANVDTRGALVAGLPAGNYSAIWTVYSRNGDTRTVRTRFIEH